MSGDEAHRMASGAVVAPDNRLHRTFRYAARRQSGALGLA